MGFRIITILCTLSITLSIFPDRILAQNSAFLGSRSFGLAHASASLADEYSVFNNPGSLGFVKTGSFAASFMNLYGIDGLNSVNTSVSFKFSKGTASIGTYSFGDKIYSKNNLVAGYGNKFGIASLGASLVYHTQLMEGFESNGFVTIDVGGLVELGPAVWISGVIKNITQSMVSRNTGEFYPTMMSTGLSFKPSDLLIINAQYDKDLLNPGKLKLALEYKYSSLILRTGFIANPALFTFGFGFHHKKLRIDYGIIHHQVLSSSHVLNLSYLFKND